MLEISLEEIPRIDSICNNRTASSWAVLLWTMHRTSIMPIQISAIVYLVYDDINMNKNEMIT